MFEKQRLIETSLIKFGLNGTTNLKFLSGGEKRKLSLASEVRICARVVNYILVSDFQCHYNFFKKESGEYDIQKLSGNFVMAKKIIENLKHGFETILV